MIQQSPLEYSHEHAPNNYIAPPGDQYASSEMYADQYNSPYGSTTQPLDSRITSRAPSRALSDTQYAAAPSNPMRPPSSSGYQPTAVPRSTATINNDVFTENSQRY